MYENAVAQVIQANDRALYYHTWKKDEQPHPYEVDFLITDGYKVVPIEVKSSNVNNHKSINEFCIKYSSCISRRILFSQKDLSNDGMLELKPIYLAPIIINELK